MAEARHVCVRLKGEWMGNPENTVIPLPLRIANNLFSRDMAEILTPDTKRKSKIKIMRNIENKMVSESIDK